jgi:hypothetical protein
MMTKVESQIVNSTRPNNVFIYDYNSLEASRYGSSICTTTA